MGSCPGLNSRAWVLGQDHQDGHRPGLVQLSSPQFQWDDDVRMLGQAELEQPQLLACVTTSVPVFGSALPIPRASPVLSGEDTAGPAHCRVPRTESRGVPKPREPKGQKWESPAETQAVQNLLSLPALTLPRAQPTLQLSFPSRKCFLASLQVPKVPELRQSFQGGS